MRFGTAERRNTLLCERQLHTAYIHAAEGKVVNKIPRTAAVLFFDDRQLQFTFCPCRCEIPLQPGSVFFVPPGSVETAINASGERFREILIELKQAGSADVSYEMANVPGPPSQS